MVAEGLLPLGVVGAQSNVADVRFEPIYQDAFTIIASPRLGVPDKFAQKNFVATLGRVRVVQAHEAPFFLF